MIKQTKFEGYDEKAIERDIKKLTKEFLKNSDSLEQAQKEAEEFVEYYKHTYRIYN